MRTIELVPTLLHSLKLGDALISSIMLPGYSVAILNHLVKPSSFAYLTKLNSGLDREAIFKPPEDGMIHGTH